MNLHGMVSDYIDTVNPNRTCDVYVSVPENRTRSGKPILRYRGPVSTEMQIQALTSRDLLHLAGLGIQSYTHAIYLGGGLRGVVRKDGTGGDLIWTLNEDGTDDECFLVTALLEAWPDWCRVAATLQTDQTRPTELIE